MRIYWCSFVFQTRAAASYPMLYVSSHKLPTNPFTSPLNIDTSSKDARPTFEATNLKANELVKSWRQSLYNNVQADDAIEIALNENYSTDEVPEIPRSAVKSLWD